MVRINVQLYDARAIRSPGSHGRDSHHPQVEPREHPEHQLAEDRRGVAFEERAHELGQRAFPDGLPPYPSWWPEPGAAAARQPAVATAQGR